MNLLRICEVRTFCYVEILHPSWIIIEQILLYIGKWIVLGHLRTMNFKDVSDSSEHLLMLTRTEESREEDHQSGSHGSSFSYFYFSVSLPSPPPTFFHGHILFCSMRHSSVIDIVRSRVIMVGDSTITKQTHIFRQFSKYSGKIFLSKKLCSVSNLLQIKSPDCYTPLHC